MPKKQTPKQTVWVVTKGEYSDTSVIGVCSTRERADALQVFCNGNEPIEYTLDEDFPNFRSGKLLWQVILQRDGDNARAEREDSAGCYDIDKANWRKGKTLWRSPGNLAHSRSWFYVWARDEQHAIKIANERRAQLIAEGLW